MSSRDERAAEWKRRCKFNDPVFMKPGRPKEILDAALLWVRDLDVAKSEVDARVAELTAQLAGSQAELDARTASLSGGRSEVEAKLGEAVTEGERLRTLVETLRAQLNQLQTEVEKANAAGTGAAAFESSATAKIAEQDATIDGLRSAAARAQAAASETEAELERAQAEVATLRKAKAEIEQWHATATEEASDDAELLREQVAKLEQQRRAADELAKAALVASKAAKVRGAQTAPEVELEDAVAAYRVAVR